MRCDGLEKTSRFGIALKIDINGHLPPTVKHSRGTTREVDTTWPGDAIPECLEKYFQPLFIGGLSAPAVRMGKAKWGVRNESNASGRSSLDFSQCSPVNPVHPVNPVKTSSVSSIL